MVKRLSNVDQDSNRIINVPDPVNALDAVNKQYIDNLQDWISVTVTTAATTATKVGTSSLGGYTPVSGDRLLVNFTLGSNVNTPTLNIDGSGAKNIRLGVTNVTTSLLGIAASVIIPMWYDGTYYQLFGSYHNTDTNTTYKSPTAFTAVTGTTQTAAVNMGYLANNAGQVTFTVPATADIGDIVEIIGLGAGGWRIASPAGDNIIYGTESVASGSFIIGTQYGAVSLRCIVANTTWEVVRWTNNIETTSGYNAADVVIAQTTAPTDTSRLWYDTAAGQSASALNAQSVQGFVPSVTPTANTIPVLDSNGKLPASALGGIAFRAIPSGTVNFTGTESDVVFGTAQYNIGSGYNTTTGEFTAPISGVYRFRAMARTEAVANTRAFVSLQVSNSGIPSQNLNFRGEDTQGTARMYVGGDWEVYLAVGGKVTLRGYAGSTVNVNAVAAQSWFTGHLVMATEVI